MFCKFYNHWKELEEKSQIISLPIQKRQWLDSAMLLAMRASTGKSVFMNTPTVHKASAAHSFIRHQRLQNKSHVWRKAGCVTFAAPWTACSTIKRTWKTTNIWMYNNAWPWAERCALLPGWRCRAVLLVPATLICLQRYRRQERISQYHLLAKQTLSWKQQKG